MTVQDKPIGKLHGAVHHGKIEKVKQLIAQGEDINELSAYWGRAGRETPLCVAAMRGKKEIAEILIDNGAKINKSSPLSYALEYEQLEVAKLLIIKGASPNSRVICSDGGLSKTFPVEIAARKGYVDIVKTLMEKGAKYDKEIIAICAAGSGSVEAIKYLISKGIDFINNEDVPVSAAMNGSMEVVQYLDSIGVDFISYDYVIIQAVIFENISVVKFLIDKGARLNVKNSNGYTLLDLARDDDNQEMIDLLKNSGVKDNYGVQEQRIKRR